MNQAQLIEELTKVNSQLTAHGARMSSYIQLVGSNYQLGNASESEKYRSLVHDEVDMLLDCQIRAIFLTEKLNRACGQGEDDGSGGMG